MDLSHARHSSFQSLPHHAGHMAVGEIVISRVPGLTTDSELDKVKVQVPGGGAKGPECTDWLVGWKGPSLYGVVTHTMGNVRV